MRVKFHGPLDRVTGSCAELHDPVLNVRLLVDCGMKQGEGAPPDANRAPFPFAPADLAFVLLTHAHLDHCGLIPRLYQEGFTGTVYCTKETAELARIVLKDAAKLGAPYGQEDVDAIRFHEPSKAVFGAPCPLGKDLFVSFVRTGHLLGATAVTVLSGPARTALQRSITFSGDVGPVGEGDAPSLLRFRMSPYPADACVVESTYGGIIRPDELRDTEARLARLRAALDEGLLGRRGVVIVPTFALGRTQDVLLDVHTLWAREPARYAGIPVFLDSPMGHRANLVYAQAIGRVFESSKGKRRPAWLGKELFSLFGLEPSDPDDEMLLLDCLGEMLSPRHVPAVGRRGALANWRRLHEIQHIDAGSIRGPALVVTGGGMCEGGRVHDWLRAHLAAPTTTVLLTGFCSPGTVGGYLAELARKPDGGASSSHEALAQEPLGYVGPVRAIIGSVGGYSAHADQSGLVRWLFEDMPDGAVRKAGRTIFVQHGTVTHRRALAQAIQARAAESGVEVAVELPTDDHGWFDLDTMAWDESDRSTEELLRAKIASLERLVSQLLASPRPIDAGTSSPSASAGR
jgi:metallo-beta-lactamase family protein